MMYDGYEFDSSGWKNREKMETQFGEEWDALENPTMSRKLYIANKIVSKDDSDYDKAEKEKIELTQDAIIFLKMNYHRFYRDGLINNSLSNCKNDNFENINDKLNDHFAGYDEDKISEILNKDFNIRNLNGYNKILCVVGVALVAIAAISMSYFIYIKDLLSLVLIIFAMIFYFALLDNVIPYNLSKPKKPSKLGY